MAFFPGAIGRPIPFPSWASRLFPSFPPRSFSQASRCAPFFLKIPVEFAHLFPLSFNIRPPPFLVPGLEPIAVAFFEELTFRIGFEPRSSRPPSFLALIPS